MPEVLPTLDIKRPNYTTDQNGRVLPVSYKFVDKLPEITQNLIEHKVTTSGVLRAKRTLNPIKSEKVLLSF